MSKFSARYANGRIKIGEYRKSIIDEQIGNPMIEALPRIFSKQEVMENVSNLPVLTDRHGNEPPEVRVQMVRNLQRIFVPLTRHYNLESEISTLLRNSYLDRNPSGDAQYWHRFSEKMDILTERVTQAWRKGGLVYNSGGFTGSFFLCGMSGVGKSTALSRILSLYPQVIHHHQYAGEPFAATQVCWLKLNCPHNSSIRGLCNRFFLELDTILQVTDYAEDYGGRTAPQMIPDVARLARVMNIGLIVVDEIQNLSLVRSQGAKQMLAFFTELIDTTGCGVVMVGTERAQEVLQQEFSQVRRNITTRPFHWMPFERESPIWTGFLKAFWDYQYTDEQAECTRDFESLFHRETVGIPDLVIKLFIASQQAAIATGRARITPELVKDVARWLFSPAQASLEDYRRKSEHSREEMSRAVDRMQQHPVTAVTFTPF